MQEREETRYNRAAERAKVPKPAIWNPEKAIEGVFCPTCNTWYDDYYGQPERCEKCGQVLSGWIDGREHPPKLHK